MWWKIIGALVVYAILDDYIKEEQRREKLDPNYKENDRLATERRLREEGYRKKEYREERYDSSHPKGAFFKTGAGYSI